MFYADVRVVSCIPQCPLLVLQYTNIFPMTLENALVFHADDCIFLDVPCLSGEDVAEINLQSRCIFLFG